MTVVRIVEATRHPGDPEPVARLVVHFATDAGESLGFRTVDVPLASTKAQARTAVLAEWATLQAETIVALVGEEWTI